LPKKTINKCGYFMKKCKIYIKFKKTLEKAKILMYNIIIKKKRGNKSNGIY
jgi:hypothetical protein